MTRFRFLSSGLEKAGGTAPSGEWARERWQADAALDGEVTETIRNKGVTAPQTPDKNNRTLRPPPPTPCREQLLRRCRAPCLVCMSIVRQERTLWTVVGLAAGAVAYVDIQVSEFAGKPCVFRTPTTRGWRSPARSISLSLAGNNGAGFLITPRFSQANEACARARRM